MDKKLGQESAFPLFDSQSQNIEWGMSKRFYAACAAMQGMLASNMTAKKEDMVKVAYSFADELLKQEEV